MDRQNEIPHEVSESESLFAHSKPRLGFIGLILSISGLAVSLGSLLVFFLLLFRGGGLDIIDYPTEELIVVGYCGLLVGITGGALGIVSWRRGENEIASAISIVLGVLLLCSGGLITLFILIPSFFF